MERDPNVGRSRRSGWDIEIAITAVLAVIASKKKVTGGSVETDSVLDFGGSYGDVADPELVRLGQWFFPHCAFEILDAAGQGVALTSIALVDLESAKYLTIWQVRERSWWVKKGDGLRGGMSSLPLDDFNVNGTIAAVEIGTLAQRNGVTWLLRSGDGGN
jgi:hypothetical protein